MKESINPKHLESLSKIMGECLDQFVLVGGAAGGLLTPDNPDHSRRDTYDIDLLVNVITRQAYQVVLNQLEELGFHHSLTEGVICRLFGHGFTLDVMPSDPGVFGFSNRWYASALVSPLLVKLESGNSIRVIDPAHFLATKFEAFNERGVADPFISQDLEDIVFLVSGREGIVGEVIAAPFEVRDFLGVQFKHLRSNPKYDEYIEAHLGWNEDAEARLEIVKARIEGIVQATT